MTTTQTTENKPTNNLIFKTSKTIGKETIYVTIGLNDECKNGYQDFHITGDLYESGKPKTDRYHLCGGCIHEDIQKFFPEFKQFIHLHLCDYEGIPTYAVENGFYHLTQGFNNTKPEDQKFKDKFCDYYRLTEEQFNILSTSKNKLQYALFLQNLGILSQWKQQANKAIESLEQMTGKTFLVDSVKTQYHAPTEKELNEEAKRQNEGFYTPEAEKGREEAKMTDIIENLKAECDKEIKKATNEFEVKKQVLIVGGEKALNNCIFYNHSNTLAFNWKSYDNISSDLVNKIIAVIQLPEGIKIENKTNNN